MRSFTIAIALIVGIISSSAMAANRYGSERFGGWDSHGTGSHYYS